MKIGDLMTLFLFFLLFVLTSNQNFEESRASSTGGNFFPDSYGVGHDMEHQQYMSGDLGHFLIICGCLRHACVRHTWRMRQLVLYRLKRYK